ncbi:MAG: zf-HC2 domain-containing protein [Verrucomicrobiota bacterium]
MKHPERDEWIPFLYGEASADTRRRLEEHLQNCPECAREIAAWQRATARLGNWQLKQPAKPAVTRAPARLLKWAAAAVVVLGLGVAIGRSSAPRVDTQALRAEIEPSVRAAIASDLGKQFATALTAARAEDRQAVITLLQEMQRQHAADYFALRKDLETVASMSEEEIRRAQQNIYRLTALSQSTQ